MGILLKNMPLRGANYKVLAVASLGQLLGSGLSTLVGVVIPLLEIGRNPQLTPFQQGVTGAMALVGIMVGSLIFGRLTDRYGYLLFYRLCPAITLVASLLAIAATGWGCLILLLFIMGFGVGGEYCLDSDYISELMPQRWRLFMVGVAKSTSSLGSIFFALGCFLMLRIYPHPEIWRWLFLIVAATTVIMLLTRIHAHESPAWLMSRGRVAEAQKEVKAILGPDIEMQPPASGQKQVPEATSFAGMFKGMNLARVIFCGLPWACEGLGVYGIGVFLPILCMTLGFESALSAGASPMQYMAHIEQSVEITTLINFFMLPGFILGLCLMRKIYHVRLQSWGFIISALGLLLLLVSFTHHWSMVWSVAGFCIFEIFLNAGPHLMTFVLPTQIYPVADRSQGAGIAACMGKIGAVAGVFFIPMLLSAGGVVLVLWVSIAVMGFGALLTIIFGRMVLPRS